LEGYAVTKSTLIPISQPEPDFSDPLTELLRQGARKLIARAVEAELKTLLEENADHLLPDGRPAVVRNGYLPERTIQTGIGDVKVRVPKVRDRSGSGIKFNSALVPPYLKRTRSVETLLPWLYLKGISTGDFQDALAALLGDQAKGVSANTISRLKEEWLEEHKAWNRRDLSQKHYVYWWADGIYCNVRMDNKLCLLVIIGVKDDGTKELVAVEDGYRESADSWYELLTDLRCRGLDTGPRLAIGDGAMGFWKAMRKVFPESRHQRCWVHKTANVLNKLPKAVQPKVKGAIHDIWMASTREEANKAFDSILERFGAKYPKAMECLEKDREELLAFYDFPAEHWVHIRTSNPIESTFATVRLRTARSRNCGSRETTLAMVFKLVQSAEKRWKRIKGFNLIGEVITGVVFRDGLRVSDQSNGEAA
jgi:transposase-like protein